MNLTDTCQKLDYDTLFYILLRGDHSFFSQMFKNTIFWLSKLWEVAISRKLNSPIAYFGCLTRTCSYHSFDLHMPKVHLQDTFLRT